MNNNTSNSKLTPLRNSYLANKPFCSPFIDNSTPTKNNYLKKQLPPSLPYTNTTSQENESHLRQINSLKRRKLNVEIHELSNNPRFIREDLLILKQRIKSKKLEIDSLKTKLAYRKKHNIKDLKVEINKWQQALGKALLQYQADCQQRYAGERILDMAEILSMLGIPNSITNFLNNFESIQ